MMSGTYLPLCFSVFIASIFYSLMSIFKHPAVGDMRWEVAFTDARFRSRRIVTSVKQSLFARFNSDLLPCEPLMNHWWNARHPNSLGNDLFALAIWVQHGSSRNEERQIFKLGIAARAKLLKVPTEV